MSERILGIDPGSIALGWAVISMDGSTITAHAFGVLRPRPTDEFPLRLSFLARELRVLMHTHAPQVLSIEEAFSAINVKTALRLGEVRGAVMATAVSEGLRIAQYPPALIKKSIVGYGRAEKHQMQQMVKVLAGLEELPPPDAADALAVAICHAWHAASGSLLR